MGDIKVSLKNLILEKVPKNIHSEPKFIALIDHVKEHKMESKEHLEKFISQQTDILNSWIGENKSTASAKAIKDKATHLEMLGEFREIADSFL